MEGGPIESTEAQPAPGQAESWAILGHLAGLAGHSAPRLAVAAGGEHGGGWSRGWQRGARLKIAATQQTAALSCRHAGSATLQETHITHAALTAAAVAFTAWQWLWPCTSDRAAGGAERVVGMFGALWTCRERGRMRLLGSK